MEQPPKDFSLTQTSYLVRVLGTLENSINILKSKSGDDSNGQSIVSSAGTLTLPLDSGDFYVMTAGTYNVNTISFRGVGKTIVLKLKNGVTLVNSASLLLKGGKNRVPYDDDLITLINVSNNVWQEVNYQYKLGLPRAHVNRNGVDTAAQTFNVIFNPGFTTTVYDSHSMFTSGSSSKFTVKMPGMYRITLAGRETGAPSTIISIVTQVLINSLGGQIAVGPNAGNVSPVGQLCFDVDLNSGDTVDPRFQFPGTAGTAVLSGNIATTFFQITKIE